MLWENESITSSAGSAISLVTDKATVFKKVFKLKKDMKVTEVCVLTVYINTPTCLPGSITNFYYNMHLRAAKKLTYYSVQDFKRI